MLEKQLGIRREDVEKLAYDDPKRAAFRNDDRLIKTLLLAALVPEVESLRALNAERLAALNHGTIKTPIPGKEGGEVLRRCRAWAANVGEIRIGEEANPTISVQLSGVDTESIIEGARREDNQGNRIRRVRQMLFEQIGIEGEGDFEQFHDFWWRNTKRSCSVMFKNVRDLPDASLESSEESWKLVIDFPFDDQGYGPRDDLSKLQKFRQTHMQGAKTLCWVPAFLSAEALKDLGMLVILEHILTGERFSQYATHLSPQDRPAAKSLLQNQKGVLSQRVESHLDAAYGLEPLLAGSLDTTHELELSERFVSLRPGFEPQPPAKATLAQAMEDLLSQALQHEFPAAPKFEAEIRGGNVNKVYQQVLQATQTQDGRAPVEKTLRPLLRQIANPLLLGEMGPDATHFVLGHHWRNHFMRKAAETGAPLTVEQLRTWIDEPRPMGLPKEAENLVILVFAAQTNRSFYLHGSPYDVALANVPEKCELREQKLPGETNWQRAVELAGSIFGVAASPLLSANNVGQLATAVKKRATDSRTACGAYAKRLRDRLSRLSLPGNLDTAGWDILEAVDRLNDDRRAEARAVLAKVRQSLASDEHVIPLAPALKSAQAKAVRLLTKSKQPANEPTDTPELPPTTAGRKVVDRGSESSLGLADAKKVLSDLDEKVREGQTIRIAISWTIEEGG
ncbi:MAG: hypothetical protein B7Z73_07285 [Planctomycetia bacterium 21-64-5]|nr:MAG: hypothetical protein B7Z73_07285 [Planctomycetia bacterium 21-64-5]